MKTRKRLAAVLLAAVALMATACGADPETDVTNTADSAESFTQQLDDRADAALEPTVAPAAPAPAEPDDTDEEAAPLPTLTTTTNASGSPDPTPTAVPPAAPTATPVSAQPDATIDNQAASSSYDGVLPAWFRIPAGFVPTGADLQTGDVDVLTVAGDLTTTFAAVCADFEGQARAAGLPRFAGDCDSSNLVYGTDAAKATAQTFGRTTGEFVFIGFELVAPAPATGSADAASPTPTPIPSGSASTITSGTFPDWYAPPAQLDYVSHRDSSNGERRIQTSLGGLDYVALCDDFRSQAAVVGLLPTTSRGCDDATISWSSLESASGADAEIQRVDGLSYDVLFVFDVAALSLEGSGTSAITGNSSASPSATPAPSTSDTASDAESDGDDSASLLPPWFDPTVYGSELAHEVDDGTYTIAAIGRIDSDATFTALCQEFERQAAAGGWNRQSGDECGEDIFDGATFTDPVTGFEAKVRNVRGDEIVYSFEVGVDLTPAEITTIAFDPEVALLPSGFSLVPGDQVIGLAESIDDTNAYNSAIKVQGSAGFQARCEHFLQEAGAVQIVLGGCDSADEIVTITYRDTTVLLEDNVYTFVTRR